MNIKRTSLKLINKLLRGKLFEDESENMLLFLTFVSMKIDPNYLCVAQEKLHTLQGRNDCLKDCTCI